VRVRWLRKALANLEEEGQYIAKDDPAAAARVVLRILRAVELLKENPAMGRPGRVTGTRELIVTETPYIVPYRVREDVVEILRVFHGARKWPVFRPALARLEFLPGARESKARPTFKHRTWGTRQAWHWRWDSRAQFTVNRGKDSLRG